MSQERKFARSLTGPGTAARMRESVSYAVRENTNLSKLPVVEPVDYESAIEKNKTLFHNDPQRELLFFPHDDVKQSTLPRRFRTVKSSVPPEAIKESHSLLVKESIKSYTSSWNVIHYKYSAYSGSYLRLPKPAKVDSLLEQVFEVDTEDTNVKLKPTQITKQGWLFKGSDSAQESGIMNFSKSLKRRYFYLKQQADTTYVVEFHKDDKKLDAKGCIFLDSAISVSKSTRRNKPGFEIHMQDKSFYYLIGDTEADVDDWVKILRKVIQGNESSSFSLDRFRDKQVEASPGKGENLKESLEHSMNPELQKYARETDNLLAKKRKDGRQKLFSIYPDVSRRPDLDDCGDKDEGTEVYKEHFGTRVIVRCEGFKLRLQANMAEDNQPERLSNPEPFFISLALYDIRENRKISEDFNFDPNSEEIRGMIPSDLGYMLDVKSAQSTEPPLHGVDPKWLSFPAQAIFSVSRPHTDIYLVARIEKVLQGSVNSCTEPYAKAPDTKVATKIHKTMKHVCFKIGNYHMPFAWGVRPVFKSTRSGFNLVELDTNSDFALYRAEPSKISEEELLKLLLDRKKPEKQGKLQILYGSLTVSLHQYKDVLQNTVTTSLLPVKPFQDPPTHSPTVEIEEFAPDKGCDATPYTDYKNLLYVYPKNLKYDGQKTFAKARNIACCVEMRDGDDDVALPLKRLRGRPGRALFTTAANTAVLHHSSSPDYSDEIKILLPVQLHEKHHLVFTFYHVSCDMARSSSSKSSSKKGMNIETLVGYAWFPLLINGRVNVGEQAVKVAVNMPPGYLSYEQLGLGKGSVGPEIRFVDSSRPLFKFNIRLVSTVYCKDQHLHNFFSHCQPVGMSPSAAADFDMGNRLKHEPGQSPVAEVAESSIDKEMIAMVKSLHAVDTAALIQFLPTLFNQLFRLLPRTQADDVALNVVRVLIHVVSEADNVDRSDILLSYVKYVFVTVPVANVKQKTVHEELARHLKTILRPTQADFLVVGKFLKHSWFFFEILIKSMAQHLISTGRIKMSRKEQFPTSYHFHIQTLVQTLVSHIVQKYKESLRETRNANNNLANFIKKCFTFMDRGFVFKLINIYMENFGPSDPKLLHEYKFEFLEVVCSHEHYIPLNLPVMRKHVKNYKDLKHDYTLSDEFRRNHFLVGLLLQEVKIALNEIRDIRKFAIATLRNLLAKHSFDDRYTYKSQQARIANLYLPLITIMLENKSRLMSKDTLATPNGDIPGRHPETPIRNNSMLSLESSSASTASGTMPKTVRDPSVFAMISGQIPHSTQGASHSMTVDGIQPNKVTHHGSSASLTSSASSTSTLGRENVENADRPSPSSLHTRSVSVAGSTAQCVVRYDKLDRTEIKDLLLCFLYISKNLSEEILLGWFSNSSEYDIIDYFCILEIGMQQFKYMGRKRITSLCIISAVEQRRVATLPAQTGSPQPTSKTGTLSDAKADMFHMAESSEAQHMFQAIQEANLSSEVALIVLDIICLYTNSFKEQLQYRDGDNAVMHKIFDLYLYFLQSSQSEVVQKHAFAALRAFINKFQRVLFVGEAFMCGKLCYEILRCCNSRLTTTRNEACALIYLLMRSNFEFFKRKSFTRVHLQMIIAVSQLISDVVGLNNSRFIDSLSVINSYANNDKSIRNTVFPVEVKDLTKRIRTVLMATAQMKEHQNDPEMLIDLQYSLAKSYTSTPELRKTWLESMARIHTKNLDYSEAAHCHIHIAALVAEYLKRRGEFPQGCMAFKSISPNVESEESGMKDDLGMQDVQYTEDHLTELLDDCARLFEKAERYELLGEIYRLIIPIYERKHNFQSLASSYDILSRAYNKVVEVMQSGKRLLGKFYRVAFFGQAFFEEEDGKEYIYKEPKATGLPEICERLRNLYSQKFGKGSVKLIMDSNKVNPTELNTKYAYIQVTYVTPFFEELELTERNTDFERNNNIRRFMFETPFTQNGRPRGEIQEQYMRRTILTTSHSFPYVKKRILVVYHKEEVLTPIEVAIDAMKAKVGELQEEVTKVIPDLKKLQLKLQGSVSVTVNAGPVAYAETFLAEDKIYQYPQDNVEGLKDIFREFVQICDLALDLNGRLINPDQREYQEALRQNFKENVDKLSDLFDEQLIDDEDDKRSTLNSQSAMAMLTAMSATSGASTV